MPKADRGATRPGTGKSWKPAQSAFAVIVAAFALSGAAFAHEPDAKDLALYATCSSAAESQLLGTHEAALCARVFMRIKLSFLPDVGPEDLANLTSEERARVNRAGYAAYLDWKAGMFQFAETLRE